MINQPLDYFKSYCQLNALPYDESRGVVTEQIATKERLLVSMSRWSFVLEGWDQYCREQIDLEMFMTLGDGVSGVELVQYPLAAHAIQAIKTQLSMRDDALAGSLVVVDHRATLGYDVESVREELVKRGSVLLVVKGVWVEEDE